MEEHALLKTIYKTEKALHLDDITFRGFPIWRIIRYKSRINLINTQVEYNIGKFKISVGKQGLSFFSGFWKFLKLKSPTVCFPFGRLALNDGTYLDKFTDPVIDQAICGHNFIIVDPYGYNGEYKRVHKANTISNEHRTIFRLVLRTLLLLKYRIVCPKEVSSLLNAVKPPFCLSDDMTKELRNDIARFFADYHYFRYWFKRVKPRRVFVVLREGYFPVIAACKKLSIPVAEFQHGITLDNTVSYTGDYDQRIDPDYFFVFGDYFKGPQFGMPIDRIVPIGWAYGKYAIQHRKCHIKQPSNVILVISSPEISLQILEAVKILSEWDHGAKFHIRKHPCENYDQGLQDKLNSIESAEIVDNKIDSAVALPQYSRVVGENSSVLYEALSCGCKVGMLDICGLHPATYIKGIEDSFTIINTSENFNKFMSDEDNKKENNNSFYSVFDSEFFNDFINKYM